MPILPKLLAKPAQRGGPGIRVSPLLAKSAEADPDTIFQELGTCANGLSEDEVVSRREKYGPNVILSESRFPKLKILFHALVNPLVILLLGLAAVTFWTDDLAGALVMVIIVVLGVSLRFFQEARADTAAAKLKAMIRVTATVVRDGKAREVSLEELVPGDVVQLAAGDMIPADLRLLSCKDLHVIQASLTGESLPVEKSDARESLGNRSPLELRNVCYLGTSVESGSARAVLVATGHESYFGTMSAAITSQPPPTAFDRGVTQFTWLMIRFLAVMAPVVFIINGLTKGDWWESFKFAIAVAVGLTPGMLPMIVSVCLSRGAMLMSRKRVIVKRLNSIQNLGAMDVLCTDKTGTLTMDKVILERYCDVVRNEDTGVLSLAYLNSYFQTGLRNLMDRAILDHQEIRAKLDLVQHEKVDEIPFDFSRKVMSVVVKTAEGKHRLICKGAPEEIYKRCKLFELEGEVLPIEPVLIQDLREEHDDLSSQGFRVLALAYKDVDPRPAYSKEDECNLVLKGYLAFLDPPKDSAAPAIRALQDHGVAVKVLTGDNDLVTRTICKQVGLSVDKLLLGTDVEKMSDDRLADAAEDVVVFARVSPAHKERIIKALKSKNHVVGFLGDGINDAPALRAADVGISVDTAVDIAKECADAILLEKSLMVLEEGVIEGRKVFANILKYIRMGASSNFGNMFSVVGASVFLPFVPMEPIQILTNNLLYDFSQVPIPTDNVDPEQIAKPRPWSMGQITRFILFIGPCSSIFDYTTFLVMLFVFGCWTDYHSSDPTVSKHTMQLFQTGWFVESLLTQTLIIHIIRTNRIPFLQSWSSGALAATSLAIIIIGMFMPFLPFMREALGFRELDWRYWPILFLTLTCYVILTQVAKTWLLQRGWLEGSASTPAPR